MSLELLNQLEAKVQTTLEVVEILRLEIDELKQENASLKNDKQAWEDRLNQLLGKFSAVHDLEVSDPSSDS